MIQKSSPTRERLIAEGLKSLVLRGFDGIGLNAILDSAGVPKGSFYYFFKSKEEFGGGPSAFRLFIISADLYREIKKRKLKGVTFAALDPFDLAENHPPLLIKHPPPVDFEP